jgi:hypothetical protein
MQSHIELPPHMEGKSHTTEVIYFLIQTQTSQEFHRSCHFILSFCYIKILIYHQFNKISDEIDEHNELG